MTIVLIIIIIILGMLVSAMLARMAGLNQEIEDKEIFIMGILFADDLDEAKRVANTYAQRRGLMLVDE